MRRIENRDAISIKLIPKFNQILKMLGNNYKRRLKQVNLLV